MKVTVVMSNDFAHSVWTNPREAKKFCDRQPTKTINGHIIHWTTSAFVVDEMKGQLQRSTGCEAP